MKKTHGRSHKVDKTYTAWINMRARCNNKKRLEYKYYGGRGIKVCKRWDKFENFLADMGEAPKNLTLDRINTNGNYSKKNCRWATRQQQTANTRRCIIIFYNGKSMTAREWDRFFGLSAGVIRGRLLKGIVIRKALTSERGIRP